MENSEHELLTVRELSEISRLKLQAHCWESETAALFDEIGVQTGWNCVDLGCGPEGILELLSTRVGALGHVTGLDSNESFVLAANDLIIKHHHPNVKIVKGNIFDPVLTPASFDLTHARFILTQTGCDQLILRRMVELTKPGGVVVSQESDWSTWSCYPKNPSWERMRDALICLFEIMGGDINAGRRTYQMFRSEHLKDVQIHTVIKALPVGHPYRSGMNQMAISLRQKILENRIFSTDEFDETLAECIELTNDQSTLIFSYVLSQVWGYV